MYAGDEFYDDEITSGVDSDETYRTFTESESAVSTNIFSETAEQIDEARAALLTTASLLLGSLRRLNMYGDKISARLAVQADGFAYGEVFDGLKILVQVLFPDDGIKGRYLQVIDLVLESDISFEEADKQVAEAHAPMAGYSIDEVRDELVRCRAYKVALADGMLRTDKLIGSASPVEAGEYLDKAIADCLAALAYRDESEEVPTDA